MRYSERLHAPWPWWLVIELFAFSLVVAVAAWAPPALGLATAVIILGGTAAALVAAGAVRVGVDDEGVWAGRCHIGFEWIDRARGCDPATLRTVMRSTSQVGSFLLTRPWIGGGVVVRVADPADPHQAWIISSRRPEEFAAAVREGIEAARRSGGTDAQPQDGRPAHRQAARTAGSGEQRGEHDSDE